MSDGTAEDALSRIFRVFDISGDGIISEKELKRIVKDMYKLIKEDAPEDVSWKEMQINCLFTGHQELHHRECFCRDGRGWKWEGEILFYLGITIDPQVTLEEFTAACMHTEQFSKMLTLKIIDIFLEDD